MILLSDGSVLLNEGTNTGTQVGSRRCARLIPDSNGNYDTVGQVGGATWVVAASMATPRAYYGSVVLRDGKVLVAGGEYTGTTTQTETDKVEIYNPVTNQWTSMNPPTGWGYLGDAPCKILPDGRVLFGSIYNNNTQIFNPVTNTWSPGGIVTGDSTEASWALLQDDSILTVTCNSQPNLAQRYIPSSNAWISALPSNQTLNLVLFPGSEDEIGPASTLPDGRCLFIGGNGKTSVYTPPTSMLGTGSWTNGPSIPNGDLAPDAPGCVEPNGKVLFLAGAGFVGDEGYTWAHAKVYEYDPGSVTPTITQQPFPPIAGFDGNVETFHFRFLMLPTGQILMSNEESQAIGVYTPTGAPNPAWAPTISSISLNANGSYHLVGTQLNGLTEGATYGDDASMSSNYPIVRLRNTTTGAISYARTFNWSKTGLTVGNTPVSVEFTLPANVNLQTYHYKVTVVANGIASSEVSL